MRRFFGYLSITLGASSGLLGLLFLVGANEEMRRVVIGALLIGFAVFVSLSGAAQVKKARLRSREFLVPELLRLARLGSGALSEAELISFLGERATLGLGLLDEMVKSGNCRRELRTGALVFVFPELQPQLVVRRCPFCGFQSPIQGAVENEPCPKCGGALELLRKGG